MNVALLLAEIMIVHAIMKHYRAGSLKEKRPVYLMCGSICIYFLVGFQFMVFWEILTVVNSYRGNQ